MKLGDKIIKGQALGFVGKTGNTDIEHLHLNALVPNEKGQLISCPVEFDDYSGASFHKNQIIEH